MTSDLHIPSIIRPHFSSLFDDEAQDGDNERVTNDTKNIGSKSDNNNAHLPKVKKEHAHVTFAPSVQAPPLEKAKTVIPSLGANKLNVDHKHYEQWARNPNRKAPSTALLRGIQQLKAKMIRDKESVDEIPVQTEPYKVSSFSNVLRERSGLSRSSNYSATALLPTAKPKTPQLSSLDASFSRSISSIRNILKPSSHVFDGVGVKRTFRKDDYEEYMTEDMKKLHKKLEATRSLDTVESTRDVSGTTPKPRMGLAKIHDRNPFPVSINQPVCIGDHMFLVNEPVYFKSSETWRLKSRTDAKGGEISVSSAKSYDKPDTTEVSRSHNVSHSASASQHLKPSFPFDDQNQNGEILGTSIHTTSAYLKSFLRKKSNRRIPAVISSAELYDFSQLADYRSKNEATLSERTKTEASIYLKGPKLTKWVPRTQRMSALLK